MGASAPETSTQSAVERLSIRPDQLLTSNSNLRRDRIHNWPLPAWAGKLPDGRNYNTCPAAGICREVCYARAGSYRFRNVLDRHERNLAYVLDDLAGWTAHMVAELGHKRHRPKDGKPSIVRIHDAGDFFSDEYLKAWLEVMAAHPDVRFYAYTKEVERFKRMVEPKPPANFKWVYSLGGSEDHLLDLERDRVADVFPTVEALEEAGYHDQAASDLLAVDGPAPVGMAVNNIPHLVKRLGDRTLGGWQAQAAAVQANKKAARELAADVAAFMSADQHEEI